MTAPEDQNGLREALAPCVAEALATFRKEYGYHRVCIEDLLIEFGEIVAGIDALEIATLRATNRDLHRRAQKAESFRERHGRGVAYLTKRRIEDRRARRAAEAEITRLKEGMEALKRFHLESLCEAHRGFVMIHDGLAESTQPKQACGEVCAHWRDRFAAEIERHDVSATLSPKEQP